MPKLARVAAVATATVAGIGYAPVAPGTFGAAAGVGLYLVLAPQGAVALGLVSAGLLGLGVLASDAAEAHFGRHDDGRIVIDEVLGQLLALLPISILAPQHGHDLRLLAIGFLAFRLFDIWKPGPVRAAERRFAGGLGVMLDDVVAGLLAAALLAVALLAGVLP